MVKAGDIIMKAHPFVHVLANKERGQRCDSCMERCESLKKCTRCHILRYCNIKCQRADWSIHKVECRCLNRVSPNTPLDSVRLMLRLVIKCKSEFSKTTDHEDSVWSRQFQDLMSHSEDIQRDEKRRDQFAKILFTLQKLMGEDKLPVPELLQIFGKMTVNTFTICDGELQSIGAGIYLSPSLLDHSCQPNAVVTFSGCTLYLRALEDIDNPGPNNTFISYIDQLSLTEERQNQLREQYYFVCKCPRCQNSSLDNDMRSVRCPVTGCKDGCIPQGKSNRFLPCVSCQRNNFDDDFTKTVDEFEKNCHSCLERIRELKASQCYKEVLERCETCLNSHKQLFHQYNIHFVHLAEEAFDACIQTSQWEKVLSYQDNLLLAYRKYYTGVSPNLGIFLMKVGKIAMYTGQLQNAMKSLQQAESTLRLTHGQDHPLYKELNELLQQTQTELAMSSYQEK